MSESVDELSLYDYELPRDLIAQHPLNRRSDARLLHLDRHSGGLEHYHVRDLVGLLKPGDLLVVNDTKVVPARLIGRRTSTGGRWEGLYLQSDPSGILELLSKTRGSLRPEETITLRDREGREVEELVVFSSTEDGKLLVRSRSDSPVIELLERFGRVPLPPYIRDGQMVDSDETSYQTVYARNPGSIAAPTAGLHFTPELLQSLRNASVAIAPVTLHVGMGTFQPVKAQTLNEHKMHNEWFEVSEPVAKKINATKAAGGRIIAIGTTTVRTLETAALRGDGKLTACSGDTNLFIRPPFQFQVIDGMLTNFHLPKSTLLMLISALAGRENIMAAYREAIDQRYRFYSYGDCMLIL
jgi:S-adenosylmethionine:tRNA ribosyltransferase-isomerase